MVNIVSKIVAFFKSLFEKIFKKTKFKNNANISSKTENSQKMKVFENFSDYEITKIKNIIRPLIKELNYTDAYINLCKDKGLHQRVLKTFSRVSYGNFVLTIFFTQNNIFNIEIESIITDTWFLDKFKSELSVLDSKYYIAVHDGNIIIRKIFS